MANYNVYIFNFMANNEKDVKRLISTFEKFNCRVKVHHQLKYADFKRAVKQITTADFTPYEYMAIVSLDKRNPFKHLLRTTDNRDVFLESELLTFVLKNKTLAGKKRLYLIQTNQNVAEEHAHYTPSQTDYMPVANLWAGPTIRLYAVEPEQVLANYWPTADAEESPFVSAFCNNFEKYANSMRIDQLFGKMYADMQKHSGDIPVIEHNLSKTEPGIFGSARMAAKPENS